MARPHIEFIESGEVPAQEVDDGALAGTIRRSLSADVERGAWTALHAFPPGWAADLTGSARPRELFVLGGALIIDHDRVGEGVYANLPAGGGPWRVSAPEGARALVMQDDERPARSGAPTKIVDPRTMRWVPSERRLKDIPPGICTKRLHEDPDTGDWSWVAAIVPTWKESRAEIHDTVEESLLIRGDVLLGGRGGMTAGSYFWRPPLIRHGPMYSHGGGYFFFRTKGGGLTVEYEEVADWQQTVDAYAASRSFYAGSSA